MLIDADPFGGGLDLLLGAEDVAGLRWPDLANTRGRLAGATLREHVPEPYGLGVLSWDRGSTLAVPDDAVSAVVGAAARACDVVIVDLPRPANPITELVLPRCTTTLLVVPADVRGVAAAARVAASVCTQTSDIRAVVRGPSPSGLRAGEVASSLGLPMAATYDAEAGLARELERGQPPGRSGRGALAAACSDVLDVVMRPPSRQARQ
jgi:secretion/DNA translocation related CpaE-like protein